MQKSNGGLQMLGFNLIWAHFEWTKYFILENAEFEKKDPPSIVKFQQKHELWKIPGPGTTLPLQIQKLDLEKWLWTLSIWAQLPETFVLLCPKPYENPGFRPQS